jgi:hypothetical protein
MAESPEGNADNFAACYAELFANKVVNRTKADSLCGKMRKIQTDRVWLPPTAKKLRAAVKAPKTTAPGMSGVPSAVWKTLIDTPELEMVLLEVMRKCWRDKRVPENWITFYMIVLEKKGDLSAPKNYRGVLISETLAKIYSSILKTRLQSLCEDLAPEFGGGFRSGRGRGDCIYTAKQTLRQRKRYGLDSYVVCWDVEKMFDRTPREFIWESMRKVGVDVGMIEAVQSTLLDTNCALHVEGMLSPEPSTLDSPTAYLVPSAKLRCLVVTIKQARKDRM